MAAPYIHSCPIGCESTLEETSIRLHEGPLRRCAQCGQLVSQCSEEAFRKSMVEFNQPCGTSPDPPSARRRFEINLRRLFTIRSLLSNQERPIRLLDVGCSSGTFLAAAKGQGFDAEGVEPAALAAETARQAGFRVHLGMLEDLALPGASFDAATLFEVIEHVGDAVSLMKECARVLRPGGVLLIGTGNAGSWTASLMGHRWEYFHLNRHGGHVSFFNPRSMRLLADRTGFATERIETRNFRLFEKDDVSRPVYRAGKILSECAALPAKLAGRGHDMLAVLRRRGPMS